MRLAHELHWPEQEMIHRMFTIRWTRGCLYTRLHGAIVDDLPTRRQIETWGRALEEVVPQLGGDFVSILDTSSVGAIPRGLWLELVELTRGMSRGPVRRALVAAEGWAGDNQAEAAQLVTAGNVRVFRTGQMEGAIEWLGEVGVIEAERLRRFLG